MTFNPFDYGSPYPEQQGPVPDTQAPAAGVPPWTAPGSVPGLPNAGGPMAGLQHQVADVLNAADPRHPYFALGDNLIPVPGTARQSSVARDMAVGAAAGFAGWIIWRRMQQRRAQKGEWTSPGFRALALLVGFPIAGFLLSMIWLPETGRLLGVGVVLGVVSFIAYASYRATGGGRYNTRRKGSPWRGGAYRRF